MLDTVSVTVVPVPKGTPDAPDESLPTMVDDPTTLEPVIFPSAGAIARAREVVQVEEAATVEAPEQPTAPATLSGAKTLFGRYRLLRELGRGGMGVVWLAHDEVLGIPVAVKQVPEALARSADDLEGLRKEVLRGIALTHPGIVRVYSFERDATSAAIVMEYVDGPSLADLKAQQPHGCFEPEQLRSWLDQLCGVLDYAHGEARIAHRDLKPRNLMVTREGKLKVADFGIASSLSETSAGISVRSDSSGTPPYMSPQQAMGERPAIADDIYSVGATLYDLLTGKPPFFRGNIIAQVLQEPPEPMNARRAELGVAGRPEISPQWERMVAACLAKSPAERPPSGAELIRLLDLSMHALVPFMPREEIKVESLRLDLAPAVRPKYDLEAQTGEAVDLPPEVEPVQAWRSAKVLPPERRTGFQDFMMAVRDEAVLWFRRVVYLLTIIGVFIGVFYLVSGWNRITAEPQPPPVVITMPGGPGQGIAVPVPQNVTFEVHYAQPPGPPPHMGPPPGWQPMPPPPPPGRPGPGGPPPGPR